MNKHIILFDARNFLGLPLAQHFQKLGYTLKIFTDEKSRELEVCGEVFFNSEVSSVDWGESSCFIHVADGASLAVSAENAPLLAEMGARAIANSQLTNVVVHSSIAADVAVKYPAKARRYGLLKLESDKKFKEHLRAEQRCCYIRPPAIYGSGFSNPVSTLAEIVKRVPITPFGAATQKRPYISFENLAEVLRKITAASEDQWERLDGLFLQCKDNEEISTRDLVIEIGKVISADPKQVALPKLLLNTLGLLVGKSELISGVFDPVECEISSELTEVLQWIPE